MSGPCFELAPLPGHLRVSLHLLRASLVAQLIQNLPAMQDTWVPSLGQEDPLEKEMATHYSIPACRIPWTEEWRATVYRAAKVRHGLGSIF